MGKFSAENSDFFPLEIQKPKYFDSEMLLFYLMGLCNTSLQSHAPIIGYRPGSLRYDDIRIHLLGGWGSGSKGVFGHGATLEMQSSQGAQAMEKNGNMKHPNYSSLEALWQSSLIKIFWVWAIHFLGGGGGWKIKIFHGKQTLLVKNVV